ncbi:MAG: hypothetical protein FWD68_21970 [Alphaproteobacteria bacterium]|nr:hypothetical protein [Alphaproteobacteria bacterium]
MNAFIQSLADHGSSLASSGRHLDVKGTAWLAAFPSPNVTIAVPRPDAGAFCNFPDEAMEARADIAPHEFSFQGASIDCGLKLRRFSAADKMSVSVELASQLCRAALSEGYPFPATFNYDGRRELKGVCSGHSYPIVSLDTERSAARREVSNLERPLLRRQLVDVTQLRDVLDQFIIDQGIEPAVFPDAARQVPHPLSPTLREPWL